MSQQQLRILVEFDHVISPQGERDVKEALETFREAVEYLGTVRSAVLQKIAGGRGWAEELIQGDK